MFTKSYVSFRFPRREDYEEVQVVQLDETYEEKLARLLDTIEVSQSNIKEVVDKVACSTESIQIIRERTVIYRNAHFYTNE